MTEAELKARIEELERCVVLLGKQRDEWRYAYDEQVKTVLRLEREINSNSEVGIFENEFLSQANFRIQELEEALANADACIHFTHMRLKALVEGTARLGGFHTYDEELIAIFRGVEIGLKYGEALRREEK